MVIKFMFLCKTKCLGSLRHIGLQGAHENVGVSSLSMCLFATMRKRHFRATSGLTFRRLMSTIIDVPHR